MDDREQFATRNREVVAGMGDDELLAARTRDWFEQASKHEYSYHFRWLGVPVIQFPQDLVALQEIIWDVQPDVIVETGIARGGSLIFHASMLRLLGGDRRVVGIDIDIRAHNRATIEEHPLSSMITLIEGSSTDAEVLAQVEAAVSGHSRPLVILDSLHTHEHVLQELRAYSHFVPEGSYLIVFDTVIEDMPPAFSDNRPWAPGDNPKTAVHAFLEETDRFVIDKSVQDKLQITVAPDGYLRCVKA